MKIVNEKVKTIDKFNLDVIVRIPDRQIKKTIIMCHGLTSDKNGRKNQLLKIAAKLCNAGHKVIQFDWRGHGKSSGEDLDVCLTSFDIDLTTIVNKYINEDEQFYMFGFSFGGFSINQYLFKNQNTSIKKVVLIGPPLSPIYSSLLNKNEFCYQEIHEAQENGTLESNGYVYWKSKNFKVSKKFLDECYNYDYRSALKYLYNRTLLLQGTNDRNVEKHFNEMFAKEYNLIYKEYEASHSLWIFGDSSKKCCTFLKSPQKSTK